MTAQDIGDGTGGGHVAMTKVEQAAVEFAATPVGMCTMQSDDPLLDHHMGALRRMMRAPGTLGQADRAITLVAMQPLVARLFGLILKRLHSSRRLPPSAKANMTNSLRNDMPDTVFQGMIDLLQEFHSCPHYVLPVSPNRCYLSPRFIQGGRFFGYFLVATRKYLAFGCENPIRIFAG